MNRFLYGSVCTAILFVVSAGELHTQPVPGIGNNRSPAVSPYLNLLRGSNGNGIPAVNYYAIIRPEIQTDLALQGLATGINQNQQMIGDLSVINGIPATGHLTHFMNYGGYFMGSGGTLAGTAGAGTMQGGGGGNAGGARGGATGGAPANNTGGARP